MAPKMAKQRSSRQPAKILKKKTHIKYGCDFAGLGTLGISLQINSKEALNTVSFEQVFACDKARFSKKFIHYVDPPKLWHDNILERGRSTPSFKPWPRATLACTVSQVLAKVFHKPGYNAAPMTLAHGWLLHHLLSSRRFGQRVLLLRMSAHWPPMPSSNSGCSLL